MLGEDEIILAEEQGAARRINPIRSSTGTLVLSNRRIVFLRADYWNDGPLLPPIGDGGFMRMPDIGYKEVYNLEELAKEPNLFSGEGNLNLSIDLESITNAKGNSGELFGRPSLTVEWRTKEKLNSNQQELAVFHQEFTGSREKNLNDWADVIMKLKSHFLEDVIEASLSRKKDIPAIETLEGKVLYILGDLQTKGVFEIESELKKRFQGHGLEFDLDPEKIESACQILIEQDWILTIEQDGIPAYRKTPPLGDEFDLSS